MNDMLLPLDKIPGREPIVRKIWADLVQEGKFSENAALISCTPLEVQNQLGGTIEKTWENRLKLPNIREMVKFQGLEFTRTIVLTYLNKLNTLSVGKNALNNEEGVSEVADEIIKDFPDLKVVEIRNIVMNAMKGKYGEIYDRIDINVIYKWINAYMADRFAHIDREREREKKRIETEKWSQENAARFAAMQIKTLPPDEPVKAKQTDEVTAAQFINNPDNKITVDYMISVYSSMEPKTMSMDDFLIIEISKMIKK